MHMRKDIEKWEEAKDKEIYRIMCLEDESMSLKSNNISPFKADHLKYQSKKKSLPT